MSFVKRSIESLVWGKRSLGRSLNKVSMIHSIFKFMSDKGISPL